VDYSYSYDGVLTGTYADVNRVQMISTTGNFAAGTTIIVRAIE
jgi:hypothetical protein